MPEGDRFVPACVAPGAVFRSLSTFSRRMIGEQARSRLEYHDLQPLARVGLGGAGCRNAIIRLQRRCELPEAPVGSTHYRVLFLGAVVLFAMTFVMNTFAELLRQRLRERNKIV